MGNKTSAVPQGSPHGNLAPADDPYLYTSGRWLNHDELERSACYMKFNFPALCDKAISLCPGATKVVKYEKKEGGFNRVFILMMDTGLSVVARLATAIAGPPQLTTNSEVATMTYLQSKLSLPIPKILAWSDDPPNQPHQIWPDMNSEQHMLCTKMLFMIIRKLESLEFPAYGSLYFSEAPMYSRLKEPFEQDFCIGPHCCPVYWSTNPGEHVLYGGSSTDCGPWRDLTSYYKGLIDTGFSRLLKEPAASNEAFPHQGSIHDHVRLLHDSQAALQWLAKDKRIQSAAAPALLHSDFHKRDIYVSPQDPTANETPDFAALPDAPGKTDEQADETGLHPTMTEQQRKNMSICHQTYDVVLKGLTLKLRPGMLLDPTVVRLFHYTHTSWIDSATAGSCPYIPTDEELKADAQSYEDFETVQRLKLWLRNSLDTNSDGWVPNEAWDAAKEANRGAYEEWIQTAREAEAKGDPFDAR
ncbi:hypothetical protein BDV19DRAFT_399356 [Aspergillus venezuelensis]